MISARSQPILTHSSHLDLCQTVHCPNCGSYAQRWFHAQTIRTECAHCDYVLVLSANAKTVVKAHHPGIVALHTTI